MNDNKHQKPIGGDGASLADDCHATLGDIVKELRELRSAILAGLGQLLTADEAAAYLGVGRTKFFQLVQLVPLPPVKLPGAGRMWRRSDLAAFVADLPLTTLIGCQ